MKLKLKVKHIVITTLAMAALAIYVGAGLAADGPSVYIRYFNVAGGNVDAYVYWDDTSGPYQFNWATDVLDAEGGAVLDWQDPAAWPTPTAITNSGTASAYVKLPTITRYLNYYFKVFTAGDNEITIVRSFPVDFNNGVNTDRKQNDYAHGNFTPDTTMCAACHSTHSALKAQLLKQATYYDLCMLCHSSSNSQSKYDVETGRVTVSGGIVDSLAGPIKSGPGLATSKHDVDDRGSVDTAVYGSDPTQILTFTCVSCHNGHGTKNDNYRLLKKTIYPANSNWNPQTVNFTAYAIVKNSSVGEEVYFVSGNTEFCAACHLDYDEGNAWVAGGVYNTVYRHPVTVGSTVYSVQPRGLWPTAGDYLPLQYYSGATTTDKRTAVVCETCHFAHGTYKTFNISLPPNGTMVSNQKMLRLDNYGVCESCHRK